MLLKPSSRNLSPIGITIKRIISKTPTNLRAHSPNLKKKFTPTVNKSFTCYKEKSLSKHQRACSLDKSKENLVSLRRSKNKSLRFTSKILSQARDITITTIKSEMESGNYQKAVELISSMMKNDSENTEILYSRGVCFMHLNQYMLAIEDFLQVFERDPIFDKQLYIAIYMCYINSNQSVMALRYLSRGLRKFPTFIQGYMIRGQLLNKLKKYDKAIKDFNKVLSLDRSSFHALLYMAESYIGLHQWELAINALETVPLKPELTKKALALKSKANLELGRFDEALDDLNHVIKHWPDEGIAHYYKAKINFEMGQFTEAALSFEQTIQTNSEPETINSSVYYLGRIKINERDFYGALHTFERAIKSCITSDLKALHLYTEAVVCLMKRKLEEGISIFHSLIKLNEPVLKEFSCAIYEGLGFAYFSLSKYEKALSAFSQARKIGSVDKSSEFNSQVSEAIISFNNKHEKKSLKTLKFCRSLFPKNPMPEMIRSCILMHQSFKSDEYLHMLIKAELLVDNVSKTREPESEIMFYRSILKFCLKNYELAFECAKKAIEKADENIAKHYIHRGFCNAMLKKFEDAVQDFTIALQLNEDLKEIYIIRAVSAYLQDDLQTAFDDLVLASKKYPKDSEYLLRISRYLSLLGSYNESLGILDEYFKGQLNFKSEYIKAQNYLYLNNITESLQVIKNLMKNSPNDEAIITDKEVITFIKDVQEDNSKVFNSVKFCAKLKETSGYIFNKKYLFWFIGILLYYNKEYSSASSYFQAVLEILHNEEPEIFADSITIEEENCEILYNLALCSLSGDTDETNANALMIFEELAEVLNTKHKGQLLFLSALIQLRQKNKGKAEKLIKEAFKCDSETMEPFINNQSTTVLPLHTSSEFAAFFPLVPIEIENLPVVYIRPAVVLPKLSIEIQLDYMYKQVSSFFTISAIVPRPEAPWLIRNKGSIQFTDNLIELTDYLETEKSVTVNDATDELSDNKSKSIRSVVKKIAKSQSILREKTFMSEDSEAKESDKDEVDMKIKFLCND